MLRSHRRKAVLTAAALIATTGLLTACQGDADGGRKSSGSGSSASDSDAKGKSDSAGEAGDDSAKSQSGGGSGTKPAGGKGVTGTWFGTVTYLAPGKYTVTDLKDTEQAFFTSTDTDIQGAGEICGDADGQAATPCSEEQLEAAAKEGVSATVKLEKGIAVSVVEDHAGSGGGDGDSGTGKPTGTRSGELGYLAPGKYSLLDSDGSRISFFSATATTINGNGWICGENGENKRCTEGDLEAAAKKGGVRVIVELDNGAAVTIDEEHN
ncbi:hypothetical protein [Streptomyces cavernicola]|uniref:Lipoprotein n=1 Tax=Streptomyces cavernicola TaxID=3043613 RepID=A0ABT6SBI2_9ACTN|nr:hypothetical protein [Streptomyces sp. B-S-A6]MDI3405556.1 hypothetical protein [Streptomyces sp. B-S-A6]